MDPSKVLGDAEECSSSESGWTMYLASPMHDDDDDGDESKGEGDGDDDCHGDEDGGGGDDDDDSMASDASSGPAHSKHSYEKSESGNELKCDKYSQCSSSYSFMMKDGKKMEKKMEEKKTSVGERRGHGASSLFASKTYKVRKSKFADK